MSQELEWSSLEDLVGPEIRPNENFRFVLRPIKSVDTFQPVRTNMFEVFGWKSYIKVQITGVGVLKCSTVSGYLEFC